LESRIFLVFTVIFARVQNQGGNEMICLHCEQPIELGKRVFLIPFPAYAEDAYGFYVEGSKRVFIPREVVEALKGKEKEEGG
jgi:hypothetical protein